MDNDNFSAYLMQIHSKITPSAVEQQSIGTLANKVMENLESIALTKPESNFGIQVVYLVGSCKKGTMLAGHQVADVIVLLRDLPVLEQTRQIGLLMIEKLNDLEIIYEPYGFDVECSGLCVRVAFAVQNADEISNVEEGIHVSQPDQKLAHAAILHARWAEQSASHPNIKALIRILKDLRRRFVGFNHLNPWQLDLLASYVIMDGPIGAPLPPSAGFRRFNQVLAAGFFLPGSTGILDPFRPKQRRVHVTLTLAQQDELCRAAQIVCIILNLEKYRVLYEDMHPTKLITLEELVTSANNLPGEKISLPRPIDLSPTSVSEEVDTNKNP
ncbi:hypothetical protein Aperf_G00000030386 [Anoplocephala perfoliata]